MSIYDNIKNGFILPYLSLYYHQDTTIKNTPPVGLACYLDPYYSRTSCLLMTSSAAGARSSPGIID